MSSGKFLHREEIVGKTVIDSSGVVTGKVKDIVFNLDAVVQLVIERQGTAAKSSCPCPRHRVSETLW